MQGVKLQVPAYNLAANTGIQRHTGTIRPSAPGLGAVTLWTLYSQQYMCMCVDSHKRNRQATLHRVRCVDSFKCTGLLAEIVDINFHLL